MIQYTISVAEPSRQYIRFSAEFPCEQSFMQIQLPVWRPGRYEIGNFAKNIRGFRVFSEDNKPLPYRKINGSLWQVETDGVKTVRIEYQYYAAELNAGSSFLSKDQLYVNPVNCFMYPVNAFGEAVSVQLDVPSNWKLATALRKEKSTFFARNFDELFDSPFIASPGLQYNQYESHGVLFHVWFNGEVKPDWKRLIPDFKAFSDSQIAKFAEFPVSEYHFLIQILPYPAYHGVEHQHSTVLALGPSYAVFKELYKELLGVASHELYHTWNVKAIRPVEMYPYDFTRENYSALGYLCEGVTTYMGDLFLLKSKVFSMQQYLDELKTQLQKHFDNSGRFNYSVAQSSFDTWLDGYIPGAPGRKVSIYTEGCLLAFVLDTLILRETGEKYGLDEVMKRLYFEFALQDKGVSADDYKTKLEQVSGLNLDSFFRDYVTGTKPFESILVEAFEYLGLEMTHKPYTSYAAGRLGFKTVPEGNNLKVATIYPGSPADLGGLMPEDEILAVNGIAAGNAVDRWLDYFDDDAKELTVKRKGELLDLTLPEVNRSFYMEYGIELVKEPNSRQKKALSAWAN